MPPGLDSLKHIVVLMMENRSFDHTLGVLKQQDARIDGLTGTETNRDTNVDNAKVQPLAEFQGQLDPIGHLYFDKDCFRFQFHKERHACDKLMTTVL